MNISECSAIVTGAASGLGREFTMSFCRAGARVAAFDINQAALEALAAEAQELGGELHTYRVDVSREEDVVQHVALAFEECGHINTLINNAGIYRDGLLVREHRGRIIKMPLTQWKAVLDVDLTGPFLMTREVAALMIARELTPGIVINIASISHHGNAGQSNYSAAKAGVIADTRVWAQELAPHGIRVAAIAPGFIQTPILKAMLPDVLENWRSRIPLGRLGEPHEIFLGVRFIIECEYFNGRCLDIDGGLVL